MANGFSYLPREVRLEAAMASLLANQPEPAKPSNPQPTAPTITLKEVQAVAAGQSPGLLIDVRNQLFHELGTIPGALNLPMEKFEAAYRNNQALLNAAPNIIVFCSDPHCPDAERVARTLHQMGHARVSVFPGGWQEWTETNRLP